MHFTKSQIEEIARRLALITKRDSELPDAEIPLDESEKVPIIQYIPLVQDYENRLLSLADLRSLVLADVDQTAIACRLKVTCNTPGATVKIKGSTRTNYIGYYGEMVDVVITANDYDAWFGVVTLTQDHTVVVSLNKSGGGSPTPGTTTYYVKINNNQSARITVNGNQVASGSMNYFESDERVEIYVTKDGYTPWSKTITGISSNFTQTVILTQSEDEQESPYIRFNKDEVRLPSMNASGSAEIQSNISWEIDGDDARTPEQDADTDEPTINDSEVLSTYNMIVGESVDLE